MLSTFGVIVSAVLKTLDVRNLVRIGTCFKKML